MKTHNLIQGSAEWLAYRAQNFNASDAPAMMGCSTYKTRRQLLHEKHTGITPEVDAATQRRFDDGHRFEALARPLAEKIIGEELYPVVGSSGKLSASFDGLTMLEDIGFEHKTLNAELRECMEGEDEGPRLPLQYRVQMEQQLMVSGAERVLFMASKWEGNTLIEERHCWYASDPALRSKIISGWLQFEEDLADYTAPAVETEVIGHTPETLPALRIEVTGMVTASNLEAYKSHALAVFAGINRELKTDQQFADAEKVVKWCGDVEARLAAAKQHALSQTESIDALFRAIDDIGAEARRTRLELDKLVKARKEAVRGEIVAGGIAALRDHIDSLNARLSRPYMPPMTADFAGAISGKRTVSSIQNAVDTTLANAKIEASAKADRIQVNLTTLRELGRGHVFLFADISSIIHKENDDLAALVKLRIAEHQQKEAARIEAETARIRAEVEQQERVKAEQAARVQMEAEAKARREAEAAERARLAEDARINAQAAAAELKAAQANPAGAELSPAAQALNEVEGAKRLAAVHPKLAAIVAPAVAKLSARQALNERLDSLSDADLMRVLSFIQSRWPAAIAA